MENTTFNTNNTHRSNKTIGIVLLSIIFSFIAGAGGSILINYAKGSSVLNALVSNTNSTVVSNIPVQVVEESSATQDVAANTSPSIVSIVISKELEERRGRLGDGFFNDPFFDQFFDVPSIPDNSQNNSDDGGSNTIEVGAGSGFIISEDGMIVTNRHVVSDTNASYTVVFADGKIYDATVLARDQLNDLALIKIDATGLQPLELGDSSKLAIGQTVIAIGNTLGEYQNTVTRGIISGLSRTLGGEYSGLIQTDAAINQGNSGGPLLNLEGQVIGINTAVDRSGEGIGFAIPINEAKVAIESYNVSGRIVRPALGIRYVPITPEVAQANNLKYEYGAYIRGIDNQFGVIPGSAADKAGLKEGNIILEVDGKKIDKNHTLPSLIQGHKVGDQIKVKVYRNEKEEDIQITLEELPQSSQNQ
ncbi:MAG TPA: trypsin-like peptidase domain-containing protein [Patescibacteria group bacterium]|nr:trypsin-like peptidase domain-containing protein [Patescibacteria group bacterium]